MAKDPVDRRSPPAAGGIETIVSTWDLSERDAARRRRALDELKARVHRCRD